MSGPIDGRVLTVVSAIRQSLQVNAGPGSSINAHPNQFFINVNGEVDLLKAAESAIARLVDYDKAAAKDAEAARRGVIRPDEG